MIKKTNKNFAYWLKVVVIGAALGLALQFVRAWTEPSTTPPGGNVGAPINTGSTAQTKTGTLGVGWLSSGGIYSSGGITSDSYVYTPWVYGKVSSPQICLNNDCRYSWPSISSYSCQCYTACGGLSGSMTSISTYMDCGGGWWWGAAFTGGCWGNSYSFPCSP